MGETRTQKCLGIAYGDPSVRVGMAKGSTVTIVTKGPSVWTVIRLIFWVVRIEHICKCSWRLLRVGEYLVHKSVGVVDSVREYVF